MAKVILNSVFTSISGRVGNIVFRKCGKGVAIACARPRPSPQPPSEKQLRQRERFAEMARRRRASGIGD